MPFSLSFTHERHKPLSELTTLGVGGPASYFAKATTVDGLAHMLQQAKACNLPTLILGKGSNILFDDKGFEGLVILNRIEHLEKQGQIWRVGAGYSFARLGLQSAKLGLSGLEFAAGIPASVGGAVFMNAGAGGFETKDRLIEVSYLNEKGELCTCTKEQLQFGYRSSSFQKRKEAIVEASFDLQPNKDAAAVQKKMVNYRLATQPYKMKSAGCAFANPAGCSAGRLIEECGLKGMRVGGVSVSTMHANFIVNDQKGSASDIKELILRIQEKVYREKAILLEVEIRYIEPNVQSGLTLP